MNKSFGFGAAFRSFFQRSKKSAEFASRDANPRWQSKARKPAPRFLPQVTGLEDRLVPAFTASLVDQALTFTGSSGNDSLYLRVNGANLEYSATAAGSFTSVGSAANISLVTIDGGNGNDTIDVSDASLNATNLNLSQPFQIRGGAGTDTFNSGPYAVDFLYKGTLNGADLFGPNGTGTSRALAEENNTIIGVYNYTNGVDQFIGFGNNTIIGSDVNHGTLNFSNTLLTNIKEVDGGAGDDTITASMLSSGFYRGNSGRDTLNAGGGNVAVTWLYSGNPANSVDTFTGNGPGLVIARAETENTVIGVYNFNNGVDEFIGFGSNTIIGSDVNHGTLNFSNTILTNIKEIDAGGGDDIVTASAISAAAYRGGPGRNTLNAGSGNVAVTWLYSGNPANSVDTYAGNGPGVVTARAETENTVIGVYNYNNGVDEFIGYGSNTIIGSDVNHGTLNFSATVLTNIKKIDAGSGNDTVTTAVWHNAPTETLYDGGPNTDSISLTFTPPQNAALAANPTLLAHVLDYIANPTGKTLTIPMGTGGIPTFGLTATNFESATKTTLNHAPTSLSLDNNSLRENAGPNALIGNLLATDPDANDTFSFSFATGAGDTNNDDFKIEGNQFLAKASFDYETKNTYTVRLRVTDLSGNAFYETPVSIHVTNVNEAPTGADNTISILEDESHTFDETDFGFADPNDAPPNDLDAVQIVSLPTSGSLRLDGVPLTEPGVFISATQISDGKLTFVPAANANGSPYATFTFQVRDNGDAPSAGGENLDPTAKTMTINVSPVEDPLIAHDDEIWVLTGTSGEPYTITYQFLKANDESLDGTATVEADSEPEFGSLVPVANHFLYDFEESGETYDDTFSYTLQLGIRESTAATVTIHVIDVAVWDGEAGDDDWSNPLNWDHDQMPNEFTHVIIPGDFTVNLADETTVRDISVTGTLNVATTGNLSVWDLSEITGALDVSGGFEIASGKVEIAGTFLNSGNTVVESGRLLILGTGSSSGSLTVMEDGEIFLGAPNYAVSGTVSSAGLVAMSGGETSFTGNFTSYATTIVNATSRFAGVNIIERLGFQGGRLESSSSINVVGDFAWGGGVLAGTGGLTIDTGAFATIGGDVDLSYVVSKNIFNYGTIDWVGDYNIQIDTGFAIENNGTMNLLSNASLTGGKLVNNGTILKQASDLETVFANMEFESNRGINIESGDIVLANSTMTLGAFPIDAVLGSSFILRGSSVLTIGNSTMTGAGTLALEGASAALDVTESFSLPNLALRAGSVSGDGSLTISKRFDWSGGSVNGVLSSGSFLVTIPSDGLAVFSGQNIKRISNAYLDNRGKSVWFGNSVIQVGSVSFTNPDNTTGTESAAASVAQQLTSATGIVISYFSAESSLNATYEAAVNLAQKNYDAAVNAAQAAYNTAINDASESSTSDTEDDAIADADEIAGPILEDALRVATEDYLAAEANAFADYQAELDIVIQTSLATIDEDTVTAASATVSSALPALGDPTAEATRWNHGLTLESDGLGDFRPTISYLVDALPKADARAALFAAYQKNYGTSLISAIQSSSYVVEKARMIAFLQTGYDDPNLAPQTSGGFGTSIISNISGLRDWGADLAFRLSQMTPSEVVTAAADLAKTTLDEAWTATDNIVNTSGRLLVGTGREIGGFFKDVGYLLREDPAALRSAIRQGVRDGAHIMSNELTFGQIPELNAEAQRLVRENGGLYQFSQLSTAVGRELLVTAATMGTGGAVARLAGRVAPNLLCRIASAQRILSPISTLQSLNETSRNINEARAALDRGDMQGASRAISRGIRSTLFLGQNLREAGRFTRALATGDRASIVDYLRACFAPGTPIQGEFGSRPIESFREGDLVWARDEHDPTAAAELKAVQEVFVHEASIWNVHIGDRIIATTEEHPFWIVGKGWTPTHELRIGDQVVGRDGRTTTVSDLLDTGVVETVYNFRVADHKTYFVGGDDWAFDVWAHNTCVKVRERRGQVIPKDTSHGKDVYGTAQRTFRTDPGTGVREETTHAATCVAEVDRLAQTAPPGSYFVYNRALRTAVGGGAGLVPDLPRNDPSVALLLRRADIVYVERVGNNQWRIHPIEVRSTGQDARILNANMDAATAQLRLPTGVEIEATRAIEMRIQP